MKIHPAASLFPGMPDDEFRALVEDVKRNGLLSPIVRLDGAILDGRHRYRACREAGVKPRFVEAPRSALADPVAYVVSMNLNRRHLDESQRAAVAVELEKRYSAEAKVGRPRKGKRRNGGKSASVPRAPQSRDKAASLMGVSGRLVQGAKKVAAKRPDLFERVRAGDLTVTNALRLIGGEEPTTVPIRVATQMRLPALEEPPKEAGAGMEPAEGAAQAGEAIYDTLGPEHAALKAFVGERLRSAFSGICVKDGKAIATDGSVLVVVPTERHSSADLAPVGEALAAVLDNRLGGIARPLPRGQGVLIPAEAIERALMLTDRQASLPILKRVVLSHAPEEGIVRLSATAGTVAGRPITATLPEYERVIPPRDGRAKVTVSAKLLRGLAQYALLHGGGVTLYVDPQNELAPIRVDFGPDRQCVAVLAPVWPARGGLADEEGSRLQAKNINPPRLPDGNETWAATRQRKREAAKKVLDKESGTDRAGRRDGV